MSVSMRDVEQSMEQLQTSWYRACALLCKAVPSVADKSWSVVVLKKRNSTGSFYKEIDKSTGKQKEIDAVYRYVLDDKTGEMYLDEPKYVVATKCFIAASFGISLYTAVQMGWSVIRCAIDTAVVAGKALEDVRRFFSGKEYAKGLAAVSRVYVVLSKRLGENMANFCKAPLYGLALEIAAIYGLFMPYEGRALIGRIEKMWHGIHYKKSFCLLGPDNGESCYDNVLKTESIYMAYCFQSRGNVANKAKFQILSRFPLV